MRSYILLLLFITPLLTSAMRVKKEYLEPIPVTRLLQAALDTIHKCNPDYKLFNPSNPYELRNCSFITPHLKKNHSEAAGIVKNRTEELSNIYLATLKHLDSLSVAPTFGTEKPDEIYYLLDLKRLYTWRLPEYPATIEDKIEMLSYYYQKKISLDFRSLLSRIPEEFHNSFKTVFCHLLKVQDYTITNVIFLDKSDEAGYFVLFRLVDQTMHLVQEVVYDLQNKRQYAWDRECGNIGRYYGKHKGFFEKQKKGL